MRALRVLMTVVLVTVGAVALLAVIAHFTARSSPDTTPKVKPRPTGTPSLLAGRTDPVLTGVTKKQARAALLTAADLPATWRAITGGDSDPKNVTTVPPGCGDRPDGTVLGRASFSLPGSEVAPGGTLDETVIRPAKGGDPTEALRALQKTLAGCLTYQASSAAGAANFELGALKMPALGNGTLAVAARAQANLGAAAGTLYITRNEVYVAAGPVLVRLVAVTFTDDLPGTSLEHLTQLAVNRLQQSAT